MGAIKNNMWERWEPWRWELCTPGRSKEGAHLRGQSAHMQYGSLVSWTGKARGGLGQAAPWLRAWIDTPSHATMMAWGTTVQVGGHLF